MTSADDQRIEKSPGNARRLLAVLVGLLAALALIVSGAGSASAQNAVGPQPVNSILVVGPHQAAGQENVGVRGPPGLRLVSATGVAADTAGTTTDDLVAACGGGSFSPDTEVVMADGSTRLLDRVKVGDKVDATDTRTGKTTAQTVTTVWVNHDTDLMNVTVKAGGKMSVINATQHHLFWDPAKHAWVEADQLKIGDALRTDSGTVATVAATIVIPGAADMWDLTVTNDHDFYVVTTTANILVHNCGSRIPDASLDSTGKVHGVLPNPADLSQYDPESLATLRDELQQSVQTRIGKTVQLGSDYGHGARQAQEQQLIESINKYLADH